MDTQVAATNLKLKNWALTIKDCRDSGLSVKAYCHQHGISKDTYYYWFGKVKEAALIQSGFVEVTNPEKTRRDTQPENQKYAGPNVIEISVENLHVSLPLNITKDTLTMVVEVIRHAE